MKHSGQFIALLMASPAGKVAVWVTVFVLETVADKNILNFNAQRKKSISCHWCAHSSAPVHEALTSEGLVVYPQPALQANYSMYAP